MWKVDYVDYVRALEYSVRRQETNSVFVFVELLIFVVFTR